MTSQPSTKVRLVRCPKCRQVLAELPDVPLYKCGGCGTVLRAKNRKPELELTDSLAKIQSNELLEAGSSSQPFTSPPEIETVSNKDSPRCNGNSLELCEGKNVLSSSPEAARFPDAGSLMETKHFPIHDSMGKIPNAYHGESSQDGSFSDELPSSGEFFPDPKVHSIPQIKQDEKDQTEHGESEWVLQKGDNFVAKVQDLIENVLPSQVKASVGQKEGYNIQENKASQIIFSANESISPPTEQIKENNKNMNGFLSNAASRCPSKESLVSFYLESSDNENPGHFPKDKRNFVRFSSIDTFGSSSPPMANYPKHGSYYSCDGSEFSYDGNYDQILQHLRQNKDVDTRSSEMVGKNRFRGHSTADRKPEWGPMRSHQWSQLPETGWYVNGNRPPFPTRASTCPGPSPRSYPHSSLPPRPIFKPPCPDPDKLDLLRIVCELQAQLNRMQFPEIRRYDHFPLKREVYSDARHPHGYNVHHGQVDVFPGKWDPPPYGPPQASCCSCPLGFPEPPFDDEVSRARLKEKYFAGKRHLWPVASGAPLVACYGCSELLRLPADFLLFDRKKCHRLKCGVCQMVLRFSLRGGTHIVPYVVGAVAPPPPDEADMGNASRSVENGDGRSFSRKSSSTEGDDRSNGKVSSGGSFEAVKDRKMKSVLTGAHGEDRALSLGTRGLRKWGPTSEIEELSSSPLHRLMGYLSPSQVLDN